MNHMLVKSVSLTVACILLGTVLYFNINPENESNQDANQSSGIKGNHIQLQCSLPTERPTMDAVSIQCPSITTSEEAQTYASQYFAQFSSIEFEESYSGKYIGINDLEMVQVFSSGTIIYSSNVDDTIVSSSTFLLEDASSESGSFISAHGGMDPYLEYSSASIMSYVEDDEPTGYIKGYKFIYHKQYQQYDILGADSIQTTVFPTYDISHFYRGDYSLGDPVDSQQVISAESAWNAITNISIKEYGEDEYIYITQISLCYYIDNHRPSIDRMDPCWRFACDGTEFYVNAFTGVLM